ncbi:MAG: outer membrane beta-barrel protein [Sideroxyarcus sp.]|nr:outer membrane beta-barrel protein [Sideroxyarcus sp.]
MKLLKQICAATLLCGIAATPAMAKGFYAAADVGQTNASDTCTGATGCSDSSTAIRAAGGYQFTPVWGVEVSYATYGKASLGDTYGDWETNGMQASGIGTFPVAESISVLGKLGVARISHKVAGTTSTKTNLAYGIGAQYDFSKGIAIRVQYERLGDIGDANTTGEARASLLSAGVLYRF